MKLLLFYACFNFIWQTFTHAQLKIQIIFFLLFCLNFSNKNQEIPEFLKLCLHLCIKKETFLQSFCSQIQFNLNQPNLSHFPIYVNIAWAILKQKSNFKFFFAYWNGPIIAFGNLKPKKGQFVLILLQCLLHQKIITKNAFSNTSKIFIPWFRINLHR
jgi:hypothetical protein